MKSFLYIFTTPHSLFKLSSERVKKINQYVIKRIDASSAKALLPDNGDMRALLFQLLLNNGTFSFRYNYFSVTRGALILALRHQY